MNPNDLIRKDLGEAVWRQCSTRTFPTGELPVAEELSPFQSSKTYIVYGITRGFDFPTLPAGSYCVYVADDQKAIRLTRAGREIESVLQEHWTMLPECDPVKLANLILKFFGEGSRSTHRVLADSDALRSQGEDYVLNEREMAKAEDLIGTTSITRHADEIVVRAVTLCGWMHDKRNLGIEQIHISKSGEVRLDERKVLSKKIFKSVPQIRY